MIDLVVSVSLFCLAALIAVGFVVTSRVKGQVHFQRVEQDGGSAMLGTGTMTGAYWMLQPIARAIVAAGISANGVTMIALFLAAFAGVLLAMGHFGLAALFVVVSSFGDALDGIVARETHTGSNAGAVLDATVDRYEEFFFLAGLAFFFRHEPIGMLLSLGALLGAIMTSYASIRAEALHVKVPRGSMRRPERAVYLAVGIALVPISAALFAGAPLMVTHAPILLALAIVASVANVSAVLRTRTIMRAVAPDAPAATVRVTEPLGHVLGRHQIGSLASTATDFGAMVFLVEGFGVSPVTGTAMGALAGASVNFALARRWIFHAESDRMAPQMARYALVSGMSLGLNTLGEHLATTRFGAPYLASRVGIALAVSLLWNFPMQRHFVFAHPETPVHT